MKNTINENKNTLNGINSRLEETGKWINNLEDRVKESNQAEHVREKKVIQNENRLRELSDSIKCNNIQITGILEEVEKEENRNLIWRNNS